MKDYVSIIEDLNVISAKTVKGYEKTASELLEKYNAAEQEFNASYKFFVVASRTNKTNELAELEKEMKQKEAVLRELGTELKAVEDFLREDLVSIAGQMSVIHSDFKQDCLQRTEQIEQDILKAKNGYLMEIAKASTEYERIYQAEVEQMQLFQKLGFKSEQVLNKSMKPLFTGGLSVKQDAVIKASETKYISNTNNEDQDRKGSFGRWLKNHMRKLMNCFRKQKK